MDAQAIRAKFGFGYAADEPTFRMGIDRRITIQFAERFRGRRVLETCTGGGFTTISLALVARRVTTVEIDPAHQRQAIENVALAGLLSRVEFLLGDILADDTWESIPPVDAAFLDPDWAVSGPDHVHRFLRSSMRPPADVLLERVFRATGNVALVLPPAIDVTELGGLPDHELQAVYLSGSHELFCAYFGDLAHAPGRTELRV